MQVVIRIVYMARKLGKIRVSISVESQSETLTPIPYSELLIRTPNPNGYLTPRSGLAHLIATLITLLIQFHSVSLRNNFIEHHLLSKNWLVLCRWDLRGEHLFPTIGLRS